MSVCHSLSRFWHSVQDPFCSRPVSILHLHQPSLLLFSVLRMSFPALPLTPSLQRASFSAFILFCFLFSYFFLFFSPSPPSPPPSFAMFPSPLVLLAFLTPIAWFPVPISPCFPSMSPTRLLGRSVLPTPWPGQCAAGCPGRAPDCSCSPRPSYQCLSFSSVTSRVHI